MKRTFVALAVAVALFTPTIASAKWTGSQLFTIAAADDVKLCEDCAYSLRSSVHWLWVPESETMLWFGYLGPKFKLADWIWVSPQLGVAGNFTPEGHDAFMTSIWVGLSPYPHIFALLELDAYFHNEGAVDYYGYYFVEWSFSVDGTSLAAGPTFEHVNDDLALGPHVTLYSKAGPWISAQYWVAAKPDFNHMTRFVVGLFF